PGTGKTRRQPKTRRPHRTQAPTPDPRSQTPDLDVHIHLRPPTVGGLLQSELMISHGLHLQVDLMAREIEFFPASDGGNRAFSEAAHVELAKHPAVGVEKVKDLAEPVDQQVRRVRALSL